MALEPFAVFTSLRYDPIFEELAENKSSPAEFPRQFFLLRYHRDRLLHSVCYFHKNGTAVEGAGKWDPAISLLENLDKFAQLVLEGVQAHITNSGETGPFRVRIVLPPPSPEIPVGEDGRELVVVECNSTPPLPLSALTAMEVPLPAADDTPQNPKWTVHIDTLPTAPSSLTSYKTVLRRHYNISRERCGLPAFGAPGATNEVILYNPDGELMEGSFTSVHFFRNGVWVTPPLSSGGCEATIRRWLLERAKVVERVVTKDELKNGEWVVMSNGVRGIWGGWLV